MHAARRESRRHPDCWWKEPTLHGRRSCGSTPSAQKFPAPSGFANGDPESQTGLSPTVKRSRALDRSPGEPRPNRAVQKGRRLASISGETLRFQGGLLNEREKFETERLAPQA